MKLYARGWSTFWAAIRMDDIECAQYIFYSNVLLIYFADKKDKTSIMYAIARPRRCPDNELIYFTTIASYLLPNWLFIYLFVS